MSELDMDDIDKLILEDYYKAQGKIKEKTMEKEQSENQEKVFPDFDLCLDFLPDIEDGIYAG
jgi:hypothetical protein